MKPPPTKSNKNAHAERRLLFVVSEDWYFTSHRIDLAVSAIAHGWTVAVACRKSNYVSQITSAGVSFREWNLPRGSHNAARFLAATLSLKKHVQDFHPSHVHAVSILTVVIARLALFGRSDIVLISTVAGLGRLSAGGDFLGILKKKALKILGSWLTKPEQYRLVTQNRDDHQLLGGHENQAIRLISGSGVDPRSFPKTAARPSSELKVLLVARMIRDKGIVEFVHAMDLLRSEGLSVIGHLVGKPDSGNPRSLSQQEIEALTSGSSVTWLGHRDDVYELIAASDVVCLPTYYGEGIPRVLLEAGCVGRAVVSCDVPGPRDLVRDGIDGHLVQPADIRSLAIALKALGANPSLIRQMGDALHERVLKHYSNEAVLGQYMNLYRGE